MEKMLLIVAVISGLVGLYAVIRNFAEDSIAELKYMLRCANSRLEIFNDAEKKQSEEEKERCKEARAAEEQEIQRLEEKIQNHWGRKIAREKNFSLFNNQAYIDSLGRKFKKSKSKF